MAIAETPDIETSSADYARRFAGPAGQYLLSVQGRAVTAALEGLKPGTALDVGGGHGQLVELLRSLGWRVTVHGTDPACEHNLRELHGRRDCDFLLGPLSPLPAADRSFDLVIAVRLLPHVDAWPGLLAEMCRVARQAVVVDYPSKSGLNALTPLLFGLKKSMEGNTRTYTSFTRRQIATELARHGFCYKKEMKQFFLPMAIHRLGQGSAVLRCAEAACRLLGLTALAGSPIILRGDRQ
jgi:ubiquinone/menaquinone biosynthesis C-methylase UbiE